MSWIGDLKDLLNLRQERKKRKLEIQEVERGASRVQIPTNDDVVKYDPKRRRLLEKAQSTHLVLLQIILAILAVLAVLFSALYIKR